ncbi:MAG TPA: YHS domain-containing protein [Myxococcota bacterium]|nr:YHS domain-containing protein [Myxococcota bacterium]
MKNLKLVCLVAVLGLVFIGFGVGGALASVQVDELADSCGHGHADCGCKKAKADCGCKDKPCDCAGAKAKKSTAQAPRAFDKPPEAGTKATCPVMGNEFTVKADSPRSEYKGKHYVFCCTGCKPKFDADPQKYAGK